MLAVLFFVMNVVQLVEACPVSCICEETETICILEKCSDEISLDYNFLVIVGKLCEQQRTTLNSLTPNTIIVLKTDTCQEIRNCRLVEKSLHCFKIVKYLGKNMIDYF